MLTSWLVTSILAAGIKLIFEKARSFMLKNIFYILVDWANHPGTPVVIS